MCVGGWVIMCVCVCMRACNIATISNPSQFMLFSLHWHHLKPGPLQFSIKNIGTRTAGARLTEGLAIISRMCNELQIELYKFGTPQILNKLKLYQGHSSFTDRADWMLMFTSIIREITVNSSLVRTIDSYCHLVSNYQNHIQTTLTELLCSTPVCVTNYIMKPVVLFVTIWCHN